MPMPAMVSEKGIPRFRKNALDRLLLQLISIILTSVNVMIYLLRSACILWRVVLYSLCSCCSDGCSLSLINTSHKVLRASWYSV